MKKNAIAISLLILSLLCACVRGQNPQAQGGQSLTALNAKYVNGTAPGYRPTAGSGLTLKLSAGSVLCSGSVTHYSGGSLTMTASATNYVYISSSSPCGPSSSTADFGMGMPIAVVITGASSITSITDVRLAPSNTAEASAYGKLESLSPVSGDMGKAITIACSSATSTQEVEALVPTGQWTVNTSGQLGSHCIVHGEDEFGSQLIAGASLGARPVLIASGTGRSPLSNIRVYNLTISNGKPGTSPTTGMNGIDYEFCNHCTVDHVFAANIQGPYGIVTHDGTYDRVVDNDVYNFACDGIATLSDVGSQYVWIQRNTVSTATNTSGTCHGITASDYTTSTAVHSQHVMVTDNAVLNVPHISCYDAHSGQHLRFIDNYGYGCQHGYTLGTPINSNSNNITDDIIVRGGRVDRGSAPANGDGVAVNGYLDTKNGTGTGFVTNSEVSGVTCTGYGSTSTDSSAVAACVEAGWTQDLKILNNKAETYYQFGVSAYVMNFGLQVEGNVCGNSLGAYQPLSVSCVAATWDNFISKLDRNQVSPTAIGYAPYYLMYNGEPDNSIAVGPENRAAMLNSSSSTMWGGMWYPVNLSGAPRTSSKIIFRAGDRGYDTNYKETYVFTPPSSSAGAGYFSMDTTDVIFQATGTAGNDYFTPSNANSTLCGGSRFWYYCYAPGANISIAGAGTGGAALTTQITGTNGLVIYIGNNLATTVSGANVTWQGGGAAIREK